MTNAYKRKKEPMEVRKKLIECTIEIISKLGPASVTLQAVANSAAVTKGGLLHHFSDKKALITAVSKHLIERFDAAVEMHMNEDPVCYGRFTRAYIKTISADLHSLQNEDQKALAIYSITEPEMKFLWNQWLTAKTRLHLETDSHEMLQLLRYAADGIWFEAILETKDSEQRHLRLLKKIMDMTKREKSEK